MFIFNKVAIKKAVLKIAEEERYHKFGIVQDSYLWKLNDMVLEYVREDCKSWPSKGKTIKG